jgi:NADH/NAD ratio-sensing transcriptional regulator Rex
VSLKILMQQNLRKILNLSKVESMPRATFGRFQTFRRFCSILKKQKAQKRTRRKSKQADEKIAH